jgi:hypothetical protein
VYKRGAAAILSVVLALAVAACDVFGGGGDGRARDTDGAAYLLQARVIEEIEPEDQFGRLPAVTITADHVVVTHGPVPAMFPGPLMPNLRARTITAAGYDRIVSEAERLGLLDPDRAARPAPLDGQHGEIVLWVDGEFRIIEGDLRAGIQCIRAPCDAAAGTAEAFGAFWAAILDLGTALPEELGPDEAYNAPALSLLIGGFPNDPAGLTPEVVQWPLDVPLAQAGGPAGDEPMPRCWTVRGEDLAVLAPILGAANQLTEWTDETGAEPVVIWVHPILVGDDPCMDFFGVMPGPS